MDNASKSIFESYDFAQKIDHTNNKVQKVEKINRSLNFNADINEPTLTTKTPKIHIADNKENVSKNVQNVEHANYDYYILKCRFAQIILYSEV